MWQSLRFSNLILRLSLAGVFLWFGIDKFFHPGYWLTAWVPNFLINSASMFHLSGNAIVYTIGVFELLVGISLVSNMFVGFFALLASIFLIIITLFYGFNEIAVRDLGLIGGLMALALWPSPGLRRNW
jgi:uncharacterized membrane protein YphA (DoxX/SURF4 family)